jgi:LCP family protein required for cell wall assembly
VFFPIPKYYFRTTSGLATPLHSVASLSTNEPPPTSSARRAAVAAFLSVLVPGVGHALIARRRAMLVFLVPVVLLTSAVLGYYAGGGLTAILAFAVAPGVLPALAIVNIALAVWRVAAGVDAARATNRPGLAIAVLGPAILLLVVAPHLWVGTTIAATNDFLDSMFASGDSPTETEPPVDETMPPNWTFPPDDEDYATDAPSTAPSGEPSPDATKGPRELGSAGTGSLPALGVSVPWQRPGAVPWGTDGKFDLLLLGSDAGPYRWSRRMDVMLLVEIDVATGKVGMIGIPRNLINTPFPPGKARNAVACGCFTDLLNALYVEATFRHPDRWPGTGAVEGIGAVRSTISGLTGRPIDAVLVADLWGVIKVVDAMGGVDVDVPTTLDDPKYPDPVYGRIHLVIRAGEQHFDGRLALAYARSRHSSSDYARMSRQQTLLLAIRDQIGPNTIVNAPALFRAAKGFAWTDLPRDSLPNLVSLFGKAQGSSVKQLRIVPPKYSEWLTPAEVTRIRNAIAVLLGDPAPAPSPSPTPASATLAPTSAPASTPTPASSTGGPAPP